jgi:hypothetical protein
MQHVGRGTSGVVFNVATSKNKRVLSEDTKGALSSGSILMSDGRAEEVLLVMTCKVQRQ